MTQLGFGAVQIGIPYGNKSNQSVMEETVATKLLQHAYLRGLRFYDTAPAYGLSEYRIGLSEIAMKTDVSIASKITKVDESIWADSSTYLRLIESSVNQSLKALKAVKLNQVLFHQCDLPFMSSRSFRKACEYLRERTDVESIGISVYEPEQAYAAMSATKIDIIQAPVNFLDDRFVSEDFQETLTQNKVSLVARSVLLQGVLVDKNDLPSVKKKDLLKLLQNMLEKASDESGYSIYDLAINYAFSQLTGKISIGLLGFNTKDEIDKVINRIESPFQAETLSLVSLARDFAKEESLFDPLTWNQ